METIIALLMFVGVDQKLTEMTWTPSISKCLEKKRIATRNSNAVYICSKVKAELDKDNKIIEGNPDKIKFVKDSWKFTRNIKQKDPNWYLSEIISK